MEGWLSTRIPISEVTGYIPKTEINLKCKFQLEITRTALHEEAKPDEC
jgi:hypothetical protein